jgi:ATP-binding cassette, subfamily B (MDR/TAP), member 7
MLCLCVLCRVHMCVYLSLSSLTALQVLNVQVPILFKAIVDQFNGAIPGEMIGAASDIQTAFTVAGTVLVGYIGARLGASLLSELRNVVFSSVAQRTIRQAALSVFKHLLHLDYAFHARANPGGLSRVIDRGIKGISFAFTALLFNIVPTVVEIGLVCGVMTHAFGPSYALVTGAMMAAYAVFTSRVTHWRTRFRREMNSADSEASVRAHDSLLQQESVKNFCKEPWEAAKYNSALQRYEQASLHTTRSLFWLNFGQQAILSAALTGVMAMAGGGIVNGVTSIGDLVMLNTLIFQLSLPLNFLGSIYREMRQSFVDMEALFALKRLQPSVQEATNPTSLQVSNGDISFSNVSFSYQSHQKEQEKRNTRTILDNISFKIPGGKKVAFVGPSGSGKSTIARLLLRHVDPQTGNIQIDQQDISQLSLNSLRKSIGIVTQDTLLFNASIRYNIAYGANDPNTDPSTISINEIERVAKAAALHDQIVLKLPQKYETLVGERGVMLSGGEKQRIAIARLLLKNPSIMIFDESTSALDTQTENSILSALNALKQSHPVTTVFIAHRLTTVMDADCIYVIDGGKIVQSGTHEEMLNDTTSLYYRLWNSQDHEKEQ